MPNIKLYQFPQGTVPEIQVTSNSRQVGINLNNKLEIFRRETPVKRRVNKERAKELSRLFKKKVETISGFTSKQKKVLFREGQTEEGNKHV